MNFETLKFLGENKKSYPEIWAFQKDRVEEIATGTQKETLIFCEHEEVVTAGRRYEKSNILDSNIPVFEIERGGDVTWHGPGQLVIYPLFRLQGEIFREGLHEYLRFWESVLISVLKSYGLEAGRFGPTGVWLDIGRQQYKKIASIGISVRRWVTYHGIALNVSNDLSCFQKIRPCNFESSVMTSLQEMGVKNLDLNSLADRIQDEVVHQLLQDVQIPKRKISV